MKLHKAAGFMLSAGALLTLIGASLGYGGQIGFGYALLPIALLLIAAGLLGRAASTTHLPRWLIGMAVFGASFALALSAMVIIYALDEGPLGASMEVLRRPVFMAFVVGAAAFCFAGIPGRHLPPVPAIVAGVGSLMLGAGVFGFEPVADVGLWLSVGGWIALGVTPWVGDSRSAPQSTGHAPHHPA